MARRDASFRNTTSSLTPPVSWQSTRRGHKISERLARQITDQIITDDLEPGTALPSEAEMTGLYNVARGTLREALRILEVQGVISIKSGPGGGPIVERLGPDDFANMATVHLRSGSCTYRQVLEARLAIDPLMARMSAQSQNPEGLALVKAAIAGADDIAIEDEPEWQRHSGLFHEAVAQMCGNPVLYVLGASLTRVVHRLRARSVTPIEIREETILAHRKIADAITRGHPKEAEELMRSHMKAYVRTMDEAETPGLDRVVDW